MKLDDLWLGFMEYSGRTKSLYDLSFSTHLYPAMHSVVQQDVYVSSQRNNGSLLSSELCSLHLWISIDTRT
jgi:hypothetical protein